MDYSQIDHWIARICMGLGWKMIKVERSFLAVERSILVRLVVKQYKSGQYLLSATDQQFPTFTTIAILRLPETAIGVPMDRRQTE